MYPKHPKQVKILALLHERGISQREFADRIGMKEDSLSRKLNGSRGFTLAQIRVIGTFLGKPIEELFITGE